MTNPRTALPAPVPSHPPEKGRRVPVNPLLPGFFPDPSVCRAGDQYCAASTRNMTVACREGWPSASRASASSRLSRRRRPGPYGCRVVYDEVALTEMPRRACRVGEQQPVQVQDQAVRGFGAGREQGPSAWRHDGAADDLARAVYEKVRALHLSMPSLADECPEWTGTRRAMGHER
jgi:hypothetical protein